MTGAHVPVMLARVESLLSPALQRAAGRPPVLVDGTLGLGGHAIALLRDCPQARLVGIDRDQAALRAAGERLADYSDRVSLVHATYDRIADVLSAQGHEQADAILLDVGLSSLQIDDLGRGFAYSRDTELDMRMDQSVGRTAADVLNSLGVDELARILREYGDERFARRIATAIVARRRQEPLRTTAQLVEVVRESIPPGARRTGGHPAKRTFQALRIEVNDELRLLADAVPAAISVLSKGGRIAVLAYHSGEDRIVKRAMAAAASDPTPLGLPVSLPAQGPRLRLLTRGAERPDAEEVAANPRAASARLRAAERIDEATGGSAGRAA